MKYKHRDGDKCATFIKYRGPRPSKPLVSVTKLRILMLLFFISLIISLAKHLIRSCFRQENRNE